MRKDSYSIIDIATMTRLSTRTIRTYIKNGLLNGNKIDGTWIFTEEEVGKFLNEKFVKQSVQIKYDSLVRDFIDNKQKSVNSVCSIFDYLVNNYEEAEVICDKIIEQVNSNLYGEINFTFNYDENNHMARVIVIGQTEHIMKMMQKCLE